MHEVSKFKTKRYGECNIITEGKFCNFKDQKTTFIIKRNLSCKLKNSICMNKCANCNKICISYFLALNNRASLHKSHIKLQEN